MKPSQVVEKLRKIATAIENSKNPDRNLVTEDLKRIVAILTEPEQKEPKPENK